MPRDLPLSNGSLLVAFNLEDRIRDIYFPHVRVDFYENVMVRRIDKENDVGDRALYSPQTHFYTVAAVIAGRHAPASAASATAPGGR